MEFAVKSTSPAKTKSACLVVGVYEDGKLTTTSHTLNKASRNSLSKILKKGDIKGKIGDTLVLHNLTGVAAERVMLIGCGKAADMNDAKYRKIISTAANTIKSISLREATSYLHEIPVAKRPIQWKVSQAVQILQASEDRKDSLKSNNKEEKARNTKIHWGSDSRELTTEIHEGVKLGKAIANGITLAKQLGDLPGNICTPTYLAEQAKTMGHQYTKLKVTILDEKKMDSLGMGALLSVSRGSRQPAKLIVMEYHGGTKKQKPIVLVGKGLTFDAGGISLKPAPDMDEMKYDMCGAASVFGAIRAIVDLGLPINVIGVVPSSENLPDGDANKPGDIVTSLSGKTIEILNTDAEGRLILCDALTYSERFDPEIVIDIATLTGACVIALGAEASGLFSNNQGLADELLKVGNDCGDRCWQLPLWDEYHDLLKSNFADLANVGGRAAGSVTAACFLSKFTEKFTWAHLDIAGTAWKSGGDKGATGRPVSLLVHYLISKSAKQ